jgi:flagellar hook protein FlgE
MIRSLRTGVAGLRTHQVRMDVIGNNIVNVNTSGFKRGRVGFQDLIGQQMGGVRGGNVGNGVRLGGVDQVWNEGAYEFTGVGTDLALGGDGFFLARGDRGTVLTRQGNFNFNGEGFLETSGGLRVQGWLADPQGNVATGALRDIRIDPSATAPPRETTRVALSGNFSADLQPGEDSSKATVTTVIYDGQGKKHTLVLTFQRTETDAWSLETAQIAGNPNVTPPIPATDLDGLVDGITFDTDGKYTGPASINLSGIFPDTDGDDLNVSLNLEGLTQFGGSTTVRASEQDGRTAGQLVGYGFDQEGRLLLSFSNGEERAIAQLALGSVQNPNGLDALGGNLYAATAVSGGLVIGRAGQEISAGVIAGAIEMSNVDLATEFTDMIVTQRGYQASARVITTSDEMLQEVVSLKR